MSVDLVHPLAESYASQYTTAETGVLNELHRQTQETHPHAHMLSSQVQGRLLSMLSHIVQPRYILEIGTFTGYSAICLSEGLVPGGQVHTIELRQADADIALKNFTLSQKDKLITLHCGNAKTIIPTLPYEWDLVFIDADKTGYIAYYEMVLPRLSEKGLIVADNVLFHGQVLEDTVTGKNALAIDVFNKHVAEDSRVEQVMLTVRDGLLIIKKK